MMHETMHRTAHTATAIASFQSVEARKTLRPWKTLFKSTPWPHPFDWHGVCSKAGT
jgi:hypothetical protein